jgi:osmotically inducible protein OsmC
VGVPGSSVKSAVSLIALANGGLTLAVTLAARLPGLEQATADQLMETTHQVCPYSNATRGNIEVTLDEATV